MLLLLPWQQLVRMDFSFFYSRTLWTVFVCLFLPPPLVNGGRWGKVIHHDASCRHDVHTKRTLQFSRKHQSLLKRNLYPCNMATRLKLKCHGSCHILIWQSYERPEQAWCFLPVCFVHLLSFFKFLLFILERKKKDSSGLEDCLETTRTASQRRLCNAKASKASKTQTLSVCESQIIIQQQVNPTTLSFIGCPKVGLEPRGGVCVGGVGGSHPSNPGCKL